MEQAVIPMDTTKYNHKHQSFYQTYWRPPYFWTRYRFSLLLQNISLHTSRQDIDSLYFCKISASILLDKISILFTFAKYRPPYIWTRYIDYLYFCKISASILLDKIYRLSLLLQNIGLHTSGQDMTCSSEVHDKGDAFSKLLE